MDGCYEMIKIGQTRGRGRGEMGGGRGAVKGGEAGAWGESQSLWRNPLG